MLPARTVAALASGLAVLLAFSPTGIWVAAPVGIGLLVLALRGARSRTGAWLGFVHGLAFLLPLLHWSGIYVGWLPWVALSVLEALFFAALGAAAPLVLRVPGWPLWFAALWVLDEALRARVPFGGFGWGRLAFSQADAPTLGLAALAGAPLVSFAVALAGASLAAVVAPGIRSRRSAPRRVVAGALALAVTLAGLLVPRPTDGTPVVAAVVQGNVPQLGLDFNAQREAVLRYHVAATEELAARVAAGAVPQPAFVVWPENSSDIDPLVDSGAGALITSASAAVGVPLLVGAVLDGPGRFISNAALVWTPQGGPVARYVKRHPAPFAEYIPWRPFVRLFSADVDRVVRDFYAGTQVSALPLGPAHAAPVICFEVVYDDLVRSAVLAGGDIITVQTNNATFGRSPESVQQLAMSRLRAVEHGRTVLSASTTGVSAIIAPDGRVLRRSEIFTRDELVATVPLRTALTPADRIGGWGEAAIAILGALVLLGSAAGAATRTARQRGRGASADPALDPSTPRPQEPHR